MKKVSVFHFPYEKTTFLKFVLQIIFGIQKTV
jgi:hypothetical protein